MSRPLRVVFAQWLSSDKVVPRIKGVYLIQNISKRPLSKPCQIHDDGGIDWTSLLGIVFQMILYCQREDPFEDHEVQGFRPNGLNRLQVFAYSSLATND